MGWTVQLVLWVVLLSTISALNTDKISRHNVNNIAKSFAGKFGIQRNNNVNRINNSQQNISGFLSRYGLNITHLSQPSVIEVRVSDTAKLYLMGSWTTIVIPFVYTFVFTASLPLNLLAILIFTLKMQLTKPAVIYMMNLASADLLFVLMLPLKITYHFSGNNWGFGSFLCRLVTGGFYAYMYCSVLLMMCISIDRFLAVVYPIRSATWRTWGRTVVICLVMWLVAIGGVLPLFLTEQTVYVTELGITTCHDVLPLSTLQSYSVYYFPTLCFLLFVIPLLVTSVCYICIISTLHSANETIQFGKSHGSFLAIIVLSVFIVCFAPTNIILLVHYLHFYLAASDSLYFAYMLCVSIGSISCCLDPLIYYYASSIFKSRLQNLLYPTESDSSQNKRQAIPNHCNYTKVVNTN
ncbi:proteinase-activated receptor 1-like isoform X3 [Chiloscyllium plagiosum]|uniref:proteinase-activated receptor 1-like isoform X3 n=1 Tax=Chiloscyllium plagiosum TaxID=36176 RepID=UPI001CB7B1B8|nr:proteinase-activated receptor 1-like isoform X3 [Chiloscyllium plagiosum]